MSLQNRIDEDLKEAMTQKNELKVSVLRLVKSAIHNQLISEKKKELNEEEIIAVLSNQAKRRKEALEAFEKGGREEMAKKEEAELKIIAEYLPAQMSEEEIKKIVQDIISKAGEQSNFGAVMGQVMAELKGKADGKVVTQIVKSEMG